MLQQEEREWNNRDAHHWYGNQWGGPRKEWENHDGELGQRKEWENHDEEEWERHDDDELPRDDAGGSVPKEGGWKKRRRRNQRRKTREERDQDLSWTRTDGRRTGPRRGLEAKEERCPVSGRMWKGEKGGGLYVI